jgi:K+-transporting ATPase ATPase C chain
VKILRTSFISLAAMTLFFGVIYPLFMWVIGQIFFREEANGSLVYNKEGKRVGSELIGQNFTNAGYFHPRPSNAGTQGYDATNSSGSNLGPTSKKLIDTISQRAMVYRAENGLSPNQPLPADAVTSSGSGLDPHISLENALLQAERIANARKLSKEEIVKIIHENVEAPDLGLFGKKRLNVLRVNLELDKQTSHE